MKRKGVFLHVNRMLEKACGSMEVDVMKTMVDQRRAGMGFFAMDGFDKRTVIWPYSGTLIYANLGDWVITNQEPLHGSICLR